MEYHLKPIGRTCAGSGRELTPGSDCHSVLVERNGQQVRLDYSEEVWSGPPEGTLGHWIARVPSCAGRPRPLDSDALLQTFEQMSEEANPANERFRYVLAILLLQRRKLQITATRSEDDSQYLEVTGVRGEGPWEVLDHRMEEAEIEALQAALTTRMAEEAQAEPDAE